MEVVLAMSDSMAISMWGINLVISIAMAVCLARVAASTRKFERLEDTRRHEVSELNDRLHATATRLIDERFRAMTHELNGHVNGFGLALDVLKDRLADGDHAFESLSERDQRIELGMLAKLDQVKDFIRAEMATSDELRRHQEAVEKRFGVLDQRLGELLRHGGPKRGA